MGSTPKSMVPSKDGNDWWDVFRSDGFDVKRSVALLDQDLGTDLDDAVGRYAKVLGGIRRGACEPNKELLLPGWHSRFCCGPQGTSGQEEGPGRLDGLAPEMWTYLRVTMSSIVQVMRDSMPTMAVKVAAPCA